MAFSIFDSYKKFTCSVHESAKQVFANHTILKVYFNNTRNISIDLVILDGVKPFKRRIDKRYFKNILSFLFGNSHREVLC